MKMQPFFRWQFSGIIVQTWLESTLLASVIYLFDLPRGRHEVMSSMCRSTLFNNLYLQSTIGIYSFYIIKNVPNAVPLFLLGPIQSTWINLNLDESWLKIDLTCIRSGAEWSSVLNTQADIVPLEMQGLGVEAISSVGQICEDYWICGNWG